MFGHKNLTRTKERLAGCWLGLVLLVALLFMMGCAGKSTSSLANGAGGGSGRENAGIDPTNEGSVQLRIGDDPATPDGRIITLRLDITSMKLWNSSTSDAIDFLGDPVSVELTHSSTITIPIGESGANPNTTYDRLNISYSGAAVSYMDMLGGTIYNQELGPLPDQTVDLSAAPVTLGSDPLVVNVNVNVPSIVDLPPPGQMFLGVNPKVRMANGLKIVDLPAQASIRTKTHGKVAMRPMAVGAVLGSNPLVTVSQSGIQTSQEQPESGQVQNFVGTVTNVVGNAITVKPASGSRFSFQTDIATNFQGVTLATAMNASVEVDGSTQKDGSLYADEVELVDVATGVELLGMATSVAPDQTLTLVVQSGFGAGMDNSLVGKTVNNWLDQSGYSIRAGDIDMTGVPGIFDGEHFFPGQQLEVESVVSLQPDPYGNAGLTVPFMVELEQQTISGTVANYVAGARPGTGTFDLLLPQDGSSPVANLNPGLTMVHVFQQSTTFPVLNSINNNTNAQVRGLMLCQNDNVNQTCASFVMAAAKITLNN